MWQGHPTEDTTCSPGQPAQCPAPSLSCGTAWRTDGRVGAPGTEPGASLRSKFLPSCLAQLGQGLGHLCSGTCFLLRRSRGRRGPRRDGAALWPHGVTAGKGGLSPYGLGWSCVSLGTTFSQSGEADSKCHQPLPVVSLRILCFSYAWSSMAPAAAGPPHPHPASK